MAVRNGVLDDDDEEAGGGLFEEEDVFFIPHDEVPPHLCDLYAGAESGDVDVLRRALDNLNGSIDEPVEGGDTALHLTCLYGHQSCAQLLLERGACIEVKDEDGGIPLHDACAGGYIEIVQLIINRADSPECLKRMLESVDADGDTPLHHAARGEHVETIRLLLSLDASPSKTNNYGKVPRELADPHTEAKAILEAATSDVAGQ